MNKIENWDSFLVEYANNMVGKEFVWGKTDCATLARRGLMVILGRNPWRGHIKVWRSKAAALRASKTVDPIAIFNDSGAREIDRGFISAGDIAIGPEIDSHGMFRFSLLVPTRKALSSWTEQGVILIDHLHLPIGTRFWRYG